ncbi:LysR family transcriptional regulator [Agarivorans sp. B2Z047]|uniref:LysR family transcriptional regulator n=1 Tax=unclassified Agarivorans TaxID=2636026 RepID=UPI00128B38B0|nr:LysR family transcriptional regulator [Agarivorans sp. B2Z047]MPW28256.1 LysR family transcriptional regulator [Agarivorans sp. B2Z047]UQN43916.1 LysR family transcriptional regulator [Agarivorans sp. B2Z047]
MDFSLSQLQAFVLTYETGSFKSAAIKVNKRSQAIAKLVANLEESCDVILFERHVRRLEATKEAKKLYKLAKRVLLDSDKFTTMLNSFEKELPTSFTIAIDSLLVSQEVIHCFKAVLEEIPTIELEVLTGNTEQIKVWVQSGLADMGLRASPFTLEEELVSISAFNFQTICAAHSNLFAQGAVVSTQELAEHTQVVPKFVFQYGLDKGHVESDNVIISNNLHTTIEMVIAQIGWAIVPGFAVRQLTEEETIVQFHIEGSVPVVWSAEVIYPSDDKLSLAGDIFIQHVQLLNETMNQT